VAVEVGQLRLMSDGTLVRVESIGPEHMPGGQWRVELSIVPRHGIIHRGHGTVARYTLLADAQATVSQASVTPPRVCPCCGTPRSLWPR